MNTVLGILPSLLMMASPILIAALGGLIAERSGVVNIALEGLMAFGAFIAATTNVLLEAYLPGWSIWLSLFAGASVGALVSLLLAFASITLKADQIIAGTGINVLANGVTVFLCQIIFFKDRTNAFTQGMNSIFFGIYPTALIAIGALVLVWFVLYRRPYGLRLRACGENPHAAAAAGINVGKIRYQAVFLSGALAGLAGGCVVLTQTIEYKENMINGAGFIALAAVSFGRWKPSGVGAASLLFGASVALAIFIVNFSSLRVFPPEVFSFLPYIITLITLVIFSGKDYAPKAAGQVYSNSE